MLSQLLCKSTEGIRPIPSGGTLGPRVIGFPSSCGRTYVKFHSLPAAQSIRQKPSLISHFAMNIFASLSACANAWMMRAKHSPIWLMAPSGAVFLVVSLTAERTPLIARRKQNDKSKMEQKAFDLCGIAAIGNIFISFGGLSLMVSQSTNLACTFLSASAAKCAIASEDSAEQCGPRSIALQISDLDHGLPVFVGHPKVAQSLSTWLRDGGVPAHWGTWNFDVGGRWSDPLGWKISSYPDIASTGR